MTEDDKIGDVEAAIESGIAQTTITERFCFPFNAEQFSGAHPLRDLPMTIIRGGDGSHSVGVPKGVIELFNERLPYPARRRGTRELSEIDAFNAYVVRYGDAESIVWADLDSFTMTAILDDFPAGAVNSDAAWREHRARYTCPRSVQWKAWTERDGKTFNQAAFGDFIEQRLEDIVTPGATDDPKRWVPNAAELLTTARDLQIHTVGEFKRTIDPVTGTGAMTYKTDHATGSTRIPRAFYIGIPVFQGGAAYRVECRVRFEMKGGEATFSYALHMRTEIEQNAFADVVRRTSDAVGAVGAIVLAGKPG